MYHGVVLTSGFTKGCHIVRVSSKLCDIVLNLFHEKKNIQNNKSKENSNAPRNCIRGNVPIEGMRYNHKHLSDKIKNKTINLRYKKPNHGYRFEKDNGD